MEVGGSNTLTNLEEISLAMKVAQKSEQPNTLISPSGTNTPTSPKQTKNVHEPLNHPPIHVAVYRTIPLEPLPILPIPKWKNKYKTVKARVDSYRKPK